MALFPKLNNLSTAKVGELIKLPGKQEMVPVEPRCNHNSTHGHWVCITCWCAFHDVMQRTYHCMLGEHKIAWWCKSCNAVMEPPADCITENPQGEDG